MKKINKTTKYILHFKEIQNCTIEIEADSGITIEELERLGTERFHEKYIVEGNLEFSGYAIKEE